MTDKQYIVIADAHLGIAEGDVEMMIDFLHTLNPKSDEILFLGDLFHIWAGPKKYHTEPVNELLAALNHYQRKEGKVHLVVGNRDVFFPEVTAKTGNRILPFDTISRDFAFFESGGKRLAAIHGDTVNRLDKQYLRWRKLVRHPLFKRFFDLLPAAWVKRIMFQLEAGLKGTNQAFRLAFPKTEWTQFVSQVSENLGPDLLIVGHFHPEEPIVHEHESIRALVVPDWHTRQFYLRIDGGLNYELRQFVGN